jgi:hypothetical protein
LCIQLFLFVGAGGGVPASFHHPLLHLKMSGRSGSPGKAPSSWIKKARFEGGGGGGGGASSSAAALSAPAPLAAESDEDGGSEYVSASEEEEEGGVSGKRRHALLAGRRKATPEEILAKKTALYAAAMAAKTTAEKDSKKSRKAVEDYVAQNKGFVEDTVEAARSTLEDVEDISEQVTMLNSLAKSIDVSSRHRAHANASTHRTHI